MPPLNNMPGPPPAGFTPVALLNNTPFPRCGRKSTSSHIRANLLAVLQPRASAPGSPSHASCPRLRTPALMPNLEDRQFLPSMNLFYLVGGIEGSIEVFRYPPHRRPSERSIHDSFGRAVSIWVKPEKNRAVGGGVGARRDGFFRHNYLSRSSRWGTGVGFGAREGVVDAAWHAGRLPWRRRF